MKKKYFSLPKQFTKDWLEALRSGNYDQCQQYLSFKGEKDKNFKYCCLGVGGISCNYSEYNMQDMELPNLDMQSYGYPEELIEGTLNYQEDLVNILTSLNDKGYELSKTYPLIANIVKRCPNIIFRKKEGSKYSFNDIADWIEDNVELYD